DWAPAGGGGHRCKVACQHCGGRHETLAVDWIRAGSRALIASEEKELVWNNRSANRAAVLVPLQGAVLLQTRFWIHGCEVGSRVEQVVAQELEQAAMERVGSRLRDCVNLRTCVLTLRGRQR